MANRNPYARNCQCTSAYGSRIIPNALKVLLPGQDLYRYACCNMDLIDGSRFKCRFRVNLETKDQALRWLCDFSEHSQTYFTKCRTFPERTTKIIYKAGFSCQHNTHPNHKVKTPHVKHTACPADMTITVKNKALKTLPREYYTSKDVHLQELPTYIVLRHDHNHTIGSHQDIIHRAPNTNVKEAFLKLLETGHSPSRALNIYKHDLQEKLDAHYFLAAGDRAICPDIHWVYRLYYNVFQKEYGDAFGPSMLQNLQSLVDRYNDQNQQTLVKMKRYDDSKFIAVLVSPLMKRVLELIPQASEIMFCDSTGSLGRFGCKTILLMINSSCGGLPIGVVITTSEHKSILSEGFHIFRSFLNEHSFHGRGLEGPKLIMTDDCVDERNALSSAFPNSIQLLCTYHLLQATWKKLWNIQTGVPLQERQHIFQVMKRMLLVESEADLEQTFHEAMNCSEIQRYPRVVSTMKQLFNRRAEWAAFYKDAVTLHGQSANSLCAEAVVVFKDKKFFRSKANSPVQLVNFFMTDFDNYYNDKILAAINGSLQHFLVKNNAFSSDELKTLSVEQLNAASYIVTNAATFKGYYVELTASICSCPVGELGAYCKHQYFAELRFQKNMQMAVNEKELQRILNVVGAGTDIVGTDVVGTDVVGTDVVGTDVVGTDIPQTEEIQIANCHWLEDLLNVSHYEEVEDCPVMLQQDVVPSSFIVQTPSEISCKEEQSTGSTENVSTVAVNSFDVAVEFKEMLDDLTSKASKSQAVRNAIQSMITNYKSLDSEAALISACELFGDKSRSTPGEKIVNIEVVNIGKLGMQSNVICERKRPYNSQPSMHTERPLKTKIGDHQYAQIPVKPPMFRKIRPKINPKPGLAVCIIQGVN